MPDDTHDTQMTVHEREQYLPRPVRESTELSVDVVVHRLETIENLMRRAMKPSVDYGVIPGTGSRPTLLKAGAEKLCVMFRLSPQYTTIKTYEGHHLSVESACRMIAPDGSLLGEANAICSTMESKYAYRKAEKTCPSCGKQAIIKGKAEYGGGWLCWKKKNGCGAQFLDDEPTIISQPTGRVPNEDLPDLYNTVIRIAEKRALIAAVRLVTGCSSIFDEEMPVKEDAPEPQDEPRHPQTKDDYPELTAWKNTVATCKTLEDFNGAIPGMSKEQALRLAQWRMLGKAAVAEGWHWSRDANKFEAPPVPAGA